MLAIMKLNVALLLAINSFLDGRQEIIHRIVSMDLPNFNDLILLAIEAVLEVALEVDLEEVLIMIEVEADFKEEGILEVVSEEEVFLEIITSINNI